jgi:hypothetical protein
MTLLALLTAALLVGLPAAASHGPPAGRTCPDAESEMHSAIAERYELYAPSRESLENGVRGMDRAVAEYARYMGEEAPRMAMVLYDTPEQRQRYGEHCFQARGLAYFSWRASMPAPPRIQTWPEMGVVFRELDGGAGLRLEALFPGGPAGGIDLREGDHLMAVDGQRVGTLRELQDRRSTLQAGATATLQLERDGEARTVAFTPAAADGPRPSLPPEVMQRLLRTAASEPTGANTIAHEAIHGLLGARFGRGNLPSWFHEGLASLAEFDGDREQRYRQGLLTRLDNTYPWDELFRMQHPATLIARDPGSAPGTTFTVASSDPTGRTTVFYSQSMTLLQFLVDRVGVDFPGRIARELAAGRNMGEILRQVEHVPHDYEALHSAWLAWVRN